MRLGKDSPVSIISILGEDYSQYRNANKKFNPHQLRRILSDWLTNFKGNAGPDLVANISLVE